MDKLILKKIAKRFCKSILLNTSASNAFEDYEDDSLLTDEECKYIQSEIIKIANKITQDAAIDNTPQLLAEYYTIK